MTSMHDSQKSEKASLVFDDEDEEADFYAFKFLNTNSI